MEQVTDDAGHAVLQQAVERYQAVLVPRPVAAYALGSLTHGASARWSPDPAVAADLLGRELFPLYLQYIDDHIARLGDVEAADLAAAFTAWRRELTA